jgi:hypothetical protein
MVLEVFVILCFKSYLSESFQYVEHTYGKSWFAISYFWCILRARSLEPLQYLISVNDIFNVNKSIQMCSVC